MKVYTPPWIEVTVATLHSRFATDLFYNGAQHGFVLSLGGDVTTVTPPFGDAHEMTYMIQKFSHSQGTRLDPRHPFAGGKLRGRYRWHAVIPPGTSQDPVFTMRCMDQQFTIENAQFDDPRGLWPQLLELVRSGETVVICGPTGSGKTTLLTKLLAEHSSSERVVIIEDIREIPGISSRWIFLQTRDEDVDGRGQIGFTQAISETLRLRPDRIVCGEIRKEGSARLLEVVLTGHRGTLFTMHAGSITSASARLMKAWSESTSPASPGPLPGPPWAVMLERGNPPRIIAVDRL